MTDQIVQKQQKRKSYKWLMTQAKMASKLLRLKIVLAYSNALFLILQAFLIASIVEKTVIQQKPLSVVIWTIFFLFCVMLLRAGLTWLQEFIGVKAATHIKTQIRKNFLTALQQLGPIQLNQKRTGAISTIFLEQIEAVQGFYADYLPQMYLCILTPLTILIFVARYDWLAAVVLLITAPLIPIFMALIGMGVESINQKNFKALALLSASFLDKLNGLVTLKLLNRSKKQVKYIEESAENYRKRTMSVLKVAFLSSGALELFSSAAIAIVAVILGLTLLGKIDIGYYGSLSLGAALFILLLAPEFFLPLRQLGVHYHARAEAIAAATELSGFELTEMSYSFELDNSNTFLIKLENISFAYPNKSELFKQYNLMIKPQEKIAIVGPSGVGKSTLMNIIMGFLIPKSGKVFLNSHYVKDASPESWQEQIAFLGQSPELLPTSIKENIWMANPKATEQEVIAAAKKAGVFNFMQHFPLGLETKVAENNLGLSGGQVQRVALARVFLANRSILILDEPTASLDQNTEEDILQSIKDNCKDKTIILISHRQATVDIADRVIEL